MSENYLTSAEFDDFVNQPGLSMIVFTASWCAPCQDLKKLLPELQQEFSHLRIAYVDIEQETELVQDFDVKSVPYVMLVRDEVVLFAESGALALSALRELVVKAMQLDMNEIKDQRK